MYFHFGLQYFLKYKKPSAGERKYQLWRVDVFVEQIWPSFLERFNFISLLTNYLKLVLFCTGFLKYKKQNLNHKNFFINFSIKHFDQI